MKISFAILIAALSLMICSCTKPPLLPGGITATGATCTISIDGGASFAADSIYWDYYGSNPRIRVYSGATAVITSYPGYVTSGARSLSYQSAYWYKLPSTIYTSTSGTLYLTNNNNVLSGTLNASGSYYSGTTSSSTSTISATFSNVPQHF